MTQIRVRLGAAVKACRVRRRMTQEQLAERSGLSYKFVGEIERGVANPTITTVDRLAAAFGIEMSALFRDAHQRSTTDYQISRHELLRVRDALESIADVTDRIGDVTYPPMKRRPRR